MSNNFQPNLTMQSPLKGIMTTKLVTIRSGTPVQEAQKIMQEKRIRHLPVVDEQDEIVGVISLRDIGTLPTDKHIPVDFIMGAPVEFVSETTPLRKVILLLLQKKISCLLVSDQNENAVGIVTTDDLLWYLAKLLDEQQDQNQPILTAVDLQTIGKFANDLSMMGI